jgi:HlyD family secretion protein
LTTGGKVESSTRTLIKCALERLEFSIKGQPLAGGGASTVLSVIPDGTMVKKGEILCELDASDYEEMLRLQKMTVERARADHRQAELDLEVARLAVTEYRDGILVEANKELAGLIALGETSWQRADDRLKWTRRMLEKGYVPKSQLSTEEVNERRAAFQWKQSRNEHQVLQRYSAPRVLRTLEGQVLGAEATLYYQDRRLSRQIDRQKMLERQVKNCVIRAPHDGFVIYANDERKQINIEPGIVVRQNQDLFYLPDMAHMEALAMVHESMADRVRPGMHAWVRLEGLPDQRLEGHVTSVAQLPSQDFFNEVRYFYTGVALDTLPEGIKPGMTAEVQITTDVRRDVLTIPTEALAIEEGEEVCYVAHEDRVERRAIKVGPSSHGEFEVTEGLDEGEQVVLNPAQFDDGLETISSFDTDFSAPVAESNTD